MEVPAPKCLHAWEGASWCMMSISTPLLLWYIYHGVGTSTNSVEGWRQLSITLTRWLMPALTTVDSHLIYTCVNNRRHGQQDLILLEHNHFGQVCTDASGSIQVLTVLIIMSLSPCKVWLKKKRKVPIIYWHYDILLATHTEAKAVFQHGERENDVLFKNPCYFI